MIRLFLPPEELVSKQISIRGEQARYLTLVLRVKPGEHITILDGQGQRYVCRITGIHRKEVLAEKVTEEKYSAESPLSIVLAQGIPKGDKMDLIVQKSTELGVKKIIPLITERSLVRSTDKCPRWRKISISASQQSGREKNPEIEEPLTFRDFLSIQSPPLEKSNRLDPEVSEGGYPKRGIILSEEEQERNLKKVLNDFQSTTGLTLLVGPEGGFSKNEKSSAIQKGFISVSLGPRILRTETAPITALSIIQYELGDMS